MVSVTSRVVFILRHLISGTAAKMSQLFSRQQTRSTNVATFLALLELLKLGEIHAEQEGTWGEIVLYPGRGKDVDEYGESATEETE